MAGEYRTSIPASAVERVSESYPDGRTRRAEYLLDSAVIGLRDFFATGAVEDE